MVSIKTANLRSAAATLPSLKSAASRPSLKRERDEANMDAERDNIPSSPSKRVRVEFKDEVEVRLVHDWEKAPEVLRHEVRIALDRHARGDDAAYEQLVEVFAADGRQERGGEVTPTVRTLRNYVLALLGDTTRLNRSCGALVTAVLQSNWVSKDENFVSIFVQFLGNLVSAQGAWLGDVLRVLVGHLTGGKASMTRSQELWAYPESQPRYPLVTRRTGRKSAAL
jgi:RNA polymerase I-specific transcription initiation factor RRN3